MRAKPDSTQENRDCRQRNYTGSCSCDKEKDTYSRQYRRRVCTQDHPMFHCAKRRNPIPSMFWHSVSMPHPSCSELTFDLPIKLRTLPLACLHYFFIHFLVRLRALLHRLSFAMSLLHVRIKTMLSGREFCSNSIKHLHVESSFAWLWWWNRSRIFQLRLAD